MSKTAKFKVGDTVKINTNWSDYGAPFEAGDVVKVDGVDHSDDTYALKDEDGSMWWVDFDKVSHTEAFQVGDIVVYDGDSKNYEVIGSDGDKTWVKDNADGTWVGRYVVTTSRLSYPDPQADKFVAGLRYNHKPGQAYYPITVVSVDEDGTAWVKFDDGSRDSFEASKRARYTVA